MSYRSMRVVAKQVVGSPYNPRPHAVFIKTTLSVMAFACALSAWAFDVRVDGLQGEPKDNVEALLTPIREKPLLRASTLIVLRSIRLSAEDLKR